MRRLAIVSATVIVALAAAVLAGAGGDDGHYRVRAIFDTAAFIVPGEDVKVAGVRVGEIESLHVTADHKAAVVLDITKPGFQDFRADARCRIRPQSLIGEQFVECTPTQQRAPTEDPPPALPVIERGPARGQRLLGVERTSTNVALDLVGNINRLPVRQRLSLIVNELGVGLAGRGGDLNAALRRTAPALQELDEVLDLLASQNRTLAKLARDSDADLAPLARERRRVTGFVSASQRTAAATAERRRQLAASLSRLPRFLQELQPTMRRLGELAGQGTPLLADLRASAPDVADVLEQMGPFSEAATPALVRLGEVGEPGIPALRASLPIVEDLGGLARQLRPVGATLADVLGSFERNEGVPRLMEWIYYQALAVNGFDSISHFLRAGLIVNTCSTYTVRPQDECLATFPKGGASASAATAGGRRDTVLERTAAVLGGADPKRLLRRARARRADAAATPQAAATPPAAPSASPAPAPAQAPAQTPAPEGSSSAAGATGDVLDYLLGEDAE